VGRARTRVPPPGGARMGPCPRVIARRGDWTRHARFAPWRVFAPRALCTRLFLSFLFSLFVFRQNIIFAMF